MKRNFFKIFMILFCFFITVALKPVNFRASEMVGFRLNPEQKNKLLQMEELLGFMQTMLAEKAMLLEKYDDINTLARDKRLISDCLSDIKLTISRIEKKFDQLGTAMSVPKRVLISLRGSVGTLEPVSLQPVINCITRADEPLSLVMNDVD